VVTKPDRRLKQIEEWIEEYHCDPMGFSLEQVARDIQELYRAELDVAESIRGLLKEVK